jgi:hypothetical protein
MKNLSNMPEDFCFPDTMSPPNTSVRNRSKRSSDHDGMARNFFNLDDGFQDHSLDNISQEHLLSNRKALADRYHIEYIEKNVMNVYYVSD